MVYLFMFVLFLLFTGCQEETDLTPASGAKKGSGSQEIATGNVLNVEITVEADAWPGKEVIKQKVTPLKVSIKNQSGKRLLVRYSDFALTSPSGKRYAALPPYHVTSRVQKPELAENYPAIAAPSFEHDSFMVAPYCDTIYPNLPMYGDPYYCDPYYYNRYHTYLKNVQLPTPEMLNQALPDGVIDSGGSVSGFVYFQRVDPDEPMVTFRADLVNAKDGDIFGTINIPFVVSE
jgi:hypothetical protein